MKLKLPKCIRKSRKESALSTTKFPSGDRLLLTDSTFSIQSQSSRVSLFKPKKRVMFIIQDYKFINDKFFTPILVDNQRASHTPVSFEPANKTKHCTAKRLQRNKIHVKSRPTRYCCDQSN